MEDGSSFDYPKSQTIAYSNGTSMLYAGSLGAILMLIARLPSLILNIDIMYNVTPNPTMVYVFMIMIGSLVSLVGGILLGLGFMMLMKRYGKTYGPILFLAVIAPFLLSQFSFIQGNSPEQVVMFGIFNSVVNIVLSVIIGFGLLSVRSLSVNPNVTGITGIFYIANPIMYMLSGLVVIMVDDLSIAFPIYLLANFVFSFIVSILLSILFYSEARTSAPSRLDW